MKFINSSAEIVDCGYTAIDGMRHIEKVARNCYKSEDKITEDSWKKILDVLYNNKHYTPLEHFSIYLTINAESNRNFNDIVEKYQENKYSIVNLTGATAYITTNFRVIVENKWHEDLKFMGDPAEFHELRITVKVICSIGVSREFNRHRCSICEQSTRYCNYSKEKFGSEITYVIPEWAKIYDNIDLLNDDVACITEIGAIFYYLAALKSAENNYMALIEKCNAKPQEARSVLPLDTATSVYYTMPISQWENFFNLRCNKAAHPDIRVIAESIKKQFEDRKFI